MIRSQIFIVSCYIKNSEQIDLLHNLCKKIQQNGYEYILTSHSLLPDHIISSSRATFFDSQNKVIPVEGRDLSKRSSFFIETDRFRIESPLLSHGGRPCYAQAHLDLVYNGIVSALKFGYSYAHFITYDADFSEVEIESRMQDLTSGLFDFVGFCNYERMLLADNWSVNLKKLGLNELLIPSHIMSERMEELLYDDCKYLENYLLRNLRKKITEYEYQDSRKGSYVTPIKESRAEWALFEYDGAANIFVDNISSSNLRVSCYTENGKDVRDIQSHNYFWWKLYDSDKYGFVTLLFDDKQVISIDLSNPSDREYWLESTKFFPI